MHEKFSETETKSSECYFFVHLLIRAHVNYILKESGHNSMGPGSGNSGQVIHPTLFPGKVRIK